MKKNLKRIRRFIRRVDKKLLLRFLLDVVIGLAFSYLILKDFYLLVFKGGCFSWFGLATNIMYWFIVGFIYEDLFGDEE